jgi:hypothetical protein
MADDEKARRERAERLRKRIGELTDPAGGGDTPPEPTPERLPGESPNDYVQRRERELKKKARDAKDGDG